MITFQQNQLLIELLKFGILITRKLNDYTRFGNQRLLSTTKIDLNQILHNYNKNLHFYWKRLSQKINLNEEFICEI